MKHTEIVTVVFHGVRHRIRVEVDFEAIAVNKAHKAITSASRTTKVADGAVVMTSLGELVAS
jgi:hypothetical protein